MSEHPHQHRTHQHRTHQPLPPRLELTSVGAIATDARLVAIGYTGSDRDYTVSVGAAELLCDLDLDAFALLDRAAATGQAGTTVGHEIFGHPKVERVLLVGLGHETSADFRRAGAAVARAARTRGPAATALAALADDEQLTGLVEGLVLGSFGFHRKTTGPTEPYAETIVLSDLSGPDRSAVVDAAKHRALASWRSRAFALTPSNEKGPGQLEVWAREAAKDGGLDVEVWDDARLARDGFGAILAVGAGSAYSSRLIRLDYSPRKANRRTPHVVIAGKGITFDTGGLSIKAREPMMTMKRDMTGAGVVIAVMAALEDLAVPVRVTGLVASAENAVGGSAMRPGDVITHYGGRTSEVGNTDAEGRLVLADALAYSAAVLKPTVVIDIATLTGAGKVALGTSLGALFANDDDLARALTESGRRAGEPVWRLPLASDYEDKLDNTFADATNAAGGPGAITAALFLQHFTGPTPWAHLDIASVGNAPKDAFEYTEGATGFGARLLLDWLSTF